MYIRCKRHSRQKRVPFSDLLWIPFKTTTAPLGLSKLGSRTCGGRVARGKRWVKEDTRSERCVKGSFSNLLRSPWLASKGSCYGRLRERRACEGLENVGNTVADAGLDWQSLRHEGGFLLDLLKHARGSFDWISRVERRVLMGCCYLRVCCSMTSSTASSASTSIGSALTFFVGLALGASSSSSVLLFSDLKLPSDWSESLSASSLVSRYCQYACFPSYTTNR